MGFFFEHKFFVDHDSKWARLLDVVDATGAEAIIFLFTRVDIVELNVVIEAFLAEGHGIVDLDSFWKLAIRFQVPRLVGGIFQDDVSFAVLVVAKPNL